MTLMSMDDWKLNIIKTHVHKKWTTWGGEIAIIAEFLHQGKKMVFVELVEIQPISSGYLESGTRIMFLTIFFSF